MVLKTIMKTQPVIFDSVTPHPEPVNIADLLNDIETTIKRHVILSDPAAAALAVWVLHTWTFELRDIVAYVAIESPEKRCGKTTLLSVLAAMARKPLIASNVTVGALFRAIDTCRPTLFIDEADTFLAGNGIMRGIINSGNTWRTAYVLRLTKAKTNQVGQGGHLSASEAGFPQTGGTPVLRVPPEGAETGLKKYSCWCPKVIAMIGQVPDTIADRSIVVPMSRKLTSETCAPLAQLDTAEIQARCARFARDMAQFISQAGKIHGEGLNDRAADTFDPLYVIARLAGGGWEQKLHAAALALNAGAYSHHAGTELLSDIVSIFILSGSEKLFSRVLTNTLREGGCGMRSLALKYASINEYRIAKILRAYGIRPSNIRIGKEVNKGYDISQFREAQARYVPEAETEAQIKEIRRRMELQAEADIEAKKEADRIKQIMAQIPKDRALTTPEIMEMVRELKEKAEKAAENVADSSVSCSGNVAG
jgi:putative DNA primase/helicase